MQIQGNGKNGHFICWQFNRGNGATSSMASGIDEMSKLVHFLQLDHWWGECSLTVSVSLAPALVGPAVPFIYVRECAGGRWISGFPGEDGWDGLTFDRGKKSRRLGEP